MKEFRCECRKGNLGSSWGK